MSVLNLGLQAIALARKRMPEEMEAEATKCNSMKALRSVAERIVGFEEAILDSISPVKVILTGIAKRLELKARMGFGKRSGRETIITFGIVLHVK